jgi:hypothetical protein
VPTLDLFFHTFRLQRSKPKGEAANKHGWVSFTQRRRLFEIYEESVRGFKDKWYVVFPKGEEGLQSIVTRALKIDEDGNEVLRPNGSPVIVEHPRFPFKWDRKHYLLPASSFGCGKELDGTILAPYAMLCDFVDGFAPLVRIDKDNNPVVDADGNVVTSRRFIDTKALLSCSTRVEAETLLSMFGFVFLLLVLSAFGFSFIFANFTNPC